MDIHSQLPFLERLAKGIAAQFGSNCEVTIHDLANGTENTIIIIENGHVTDRRVGDAASEIVLRALKAGDKDVEDHYAYMTRTKSGRIIKSTSIYLRDDAGKIIGLLGINYDITELTMASQAIANAIAVEPANGQEGVETITSNVSDLLDQLIDESYRFIGKPVALMTKEDKTRAIQYLDKKGAFLIKKSGDRITKFYDISKYTLYNYLDAEM